MKIWQLAGAALIVALAVAACTGPGEAVPQGVNEGNSAQDFTLEAVDGTRISLKDYRGNVVLINFWATWCPPCKAEIPDFEAAYREHQDRGFVVLGVNVEDPQETVAPFVADLDMTYPVLLDKDGRVTKSYRALGLPMSLVVDQEGVIQVRHMGYLSGTQLEEYLARFLP